MTRLLACLLLLAAAARADGKFVSTAVPVVEIPDQRAIVVFKDGRERLVIDTAYAGADGDLAWIVPLPAPPKIEPVSPGVFRTLEVVTMPDLVDEPSAAWRIALSLLILVAVMAVIPGGHVLARVAVLIVWFVAFCFLTLFALTAKGGGEGVTVLGRTEAGRYETATLEARDAGELLSWLGENGFRVSPDVREGVEAYVADGWVFAVGRLRAEAAGARPHPLSFDFATEEAVYPLRLTGKQDRPLSLRIFVLADERARCDRLATESCYSIGPAEYHHPYRRDEGEHREIGQHELLRLANGAVVLTTLGGELEPAEMRRDLVVRFEEFAPRVPRYFSRHAAATGALSMALWAAFLLLLPCHAAVWAAAKRRAGRGWYAILVRSRVGRIARRGQLVAWATALALGLAAGAVDYATADVVAVRGQDADSLDTLSLYHRHLDASKEIAETDPVEKAREIAAREWKGLRNPYDGLPVREEWSPGNYGFEMIDGKVHYVHYDARGTARALR